MDQELEDVTEYLRKLLERRDTLTSTNVKMRLAAVEKALTAEPMDTDAANRALRAAVRKMIMKPAEGTLDIYWHHADAPQEVRFVTGRYQPPFEVVEGAYSVKRQRRSKKQGQ